MRPEDIKPYQIDKNVQIPDGGSQVAARAMLTLRLLEIGDSSIIRGYAHRDLEVLTTALYPSIFAVANENNSIRVWRIR